MSRLDDRLFDRHLDDDEEVTMIVHKHWLLGVNHMAWPTIAFLLGIGVLYLAPFRTVFYGTAVWSVVAVVWWMRNFFDYYLDAWIITNQGIIDVAWHGWFHRQSTRVLYSDIQGVSYEIQGVFGTLMRYGEISVEKISTGSVMSLDHVASPRSVESAILENMEQYLHGKNMADSKHVQEILSAIVAREMQLEDFEEEDEEGEDDDEEYEDDELIEDEEGVEYVEYEEYVDDKQS